MPTDPAPGPAELVTSTALDQDSLSNTDIRKMTTLKPSGLTKSSTGNGRNNLLDAVSEIKRTDQASSFDSRGTTPDTDESENSAVAATTTITTMTGEGVDDETAGTMTETITHIGASKVSREVRPDGSYYLKPIAARGIRKIKTRTIRSFTPRTSHFDRFNPDSQVDPFRGFFTLFWIFIAVWAVRTGVGHYNEKGTVWGRTFAMMISEDALMLALSDAVMVSASVLCVPFVQLINKGYIRYYWTGAVIQHVLQTAYLFSAIRWTFHRQWPWVQSGFMTLHSLTMIMKIHSYCSYNGELSEKRRRLIHLETTFTESVKNLGGLQKAQEEARRVHQEAEKAISGNGTINGDSQASAKDPIILKTSAEVDNTPAVGSKLTRRHSGMSPSSKPHVHSESDRAAAKPSSFYSSRANNVYETLSWHPNEALSKLAGEMLDLTNDLRSGGKYDVKFPNNVGYWNFFDYLLVPTLVYQLEYPRTDTIRPMYILEKTLATIGTFSLLVMIVEHYILPISPNAHQNGFFTTMLDLAMPFMINYLLIFYIIFECICNGFAELTRFADREFYQDWWNSTSFDEFSRRWNVPVHTFLLRHVYASTMSTYQFSKFQAAFVTFLLSAAVHELVMAVVTKKIRLYLFVMQMAQLPLIMVGRLPIFRQYPALGNLFFWIGLLGGFPFLGVAYIRF